MKNLRFVFAALALVALTTVGTSFKASAQSPVFYEFVGVPDFVVGTSSSTILTNQSKWSSALSSKPSCPTPQHTLCAIKVERISGGTTLPSLGDVLAKLKLKYDQLDVAGTLLATFVDGYFFDVTIGGITVRITVFMKLDAI